MAAAIIDAGKIADARQADAGAAIAGEGGVSRALELREQHRPGRDVVDMGVERVDRDILVGELAEAAERHRLGAGAVPDLVDVIDVPRDRGV